MSNLIIVHRNNQDGSEQIIGKIINNETRAPFIWQTCRRKIYFYDEINFNQNERLESDEVFVGLDAEEFLIHVLCGLKSPLLGETEVFGQFKKWWHELEDSSFKHKFSTRIQAIYSAVKKIREESMCGLGSQSYGSLLRKKISENPQTADQSTQIDFIGAGQLVEEIQPWIQKKWKYRIWCRNPEKLKNKKWSEAAVQILNLNATSTVSKIVVVAAPLEHEALDLWLAPRTRDESVHIYDFRSNSLSYSPPSMVKSYFNLNDFTTEVAAHKNQIEEKIHEAGLRVAAWKQEETSRAQVRPFGWDDL